MLNFRVLRFIFALWFSLERVGEKRDVFGREREAGIRVDAGERRVFGAAVVEFEFLFEDSKLKVREREHVFDHERTEPGEPGEGERERERERDARLRNGRSKKTRRGEFCRASRGRGGSRGA